MAEPAGGAASRGRNILLLPATLRIGQDGTAYQVRIRNLSAGGVMAEYAAGAVIGAAVSIEVQGLGWVGGRVAWSLEGRIGIAFDRPVDLKQVHPAAYRAETPSPTGSDPR